MVKIIEKHDDHTKKSMRFTCGNCNTVLAMNGGKSTIAATICIMLLNVRTADIELTSRRYEGE